MTVVLIHGFTGSPSEMQLLAESLNAEGYGVEVPLLVGHGTTLKALMGVHPQQWVAPLDALITRLLSEGQSVVVGGLSLGSILSLQLALRYPQIKALLLYSPPHTQRRSAPFFGAFAYPFHAIVAKAGL